MHRRDFIKNSAFVLAAFSGSTSTTHALQNSQYFQGDTMKITDSALKNYQMLFGDPTQSTLFQSDPEYFVNYVNFVFGEIFAHSPSIDLKTRLQLILVATTAAQGLDEFSAFVIPATQNGVSPVAIKEIIYQTTPYIGAAKSLTFLKQTNHLFKENAIALPLPGQQTTNLENRHEKGLGIQRQFFGAGIDKGNAAAPADEQHIRRFLSANCFGDYYTRAGLDLNFRELLTFVILASLGGADPQVKAHVQGNLNIGHSRQFLIEVVTAILPYIGYPRSLNALAAIDALVPFQK